MDIVLDSNIFRSDFLLRSKEFDILLDYLTKTESHFIVPQIILDEIKGLYVRALNERLLDLKKSSNNVNLTLVDNSLHLKEFSCDIPKELEKYEIFIKTKLRLRQQDILPYNNNFLPEIASRGIKVGILNAINAMEGASAKTVTALARLAKKNNLGS